MKVKTLEAKFKEILTNQQLQSTEIYIVESVKDWANAHGVTEDNPFRLAMTGKRHGSNISDIAIKATINKEDIKGVTSAMWFRGFKHYKELESDLKKFVFHTFLHEVAHIKGLKEELEADNWAWEHIGLAK